MQSRETMVLGKVLDCDAKSKVLVADWEVKQVLVEHFPVMAL
jgi:hypothetical protein